MMTMTVINFTKDILLNYSAHYPSSFRKAAIVNAPYAHSAAQHRADLSRLSHALRAYVLRCSLSRRAWMPRMWRLISHVLPTSVKAKVKILDTDYYKELSEDLTDECLAWIECSNGDLIRAPHPPPSQEAQGGGTPEEPLDGDPVVVEGDADDP